MKKYIQFVRFIFNNKKIQERYKLGKLLETDKYYANTQRETSNEGLKRPFRYDVINYILNTFKRETTYLEIGVRNPEDNFNKIKATQKKSVDPGFENSENPVDFKMTSDVFFEKLKNNQILSNKTKFDVIFIDGLHLAEQVERDIENSLKHLKEDGFIVMHDCNPPTEFHARETYEYKLSPSKGYWNGTTWKAFFKYRKKTKYYSCCIDTDWGVGIISKDKNIGSFSKIENPYFEFKTFENNRKESLNLISFEEFKRIIK